MIKIFEEKENPYTFFSGRNILAPQPRATGYGIESAYFIAVKIWCTMPYSLKESQTLNSFKTGIKRHRFIATVDCVKDLLTNVGFL